MKTTDEAIFITINCLDMFYGKKPYEVGRIVRLIKEPDNQYDKEAIGVFLPFIDRIGYVANSVKTVYAGTYSAGRIYDCFENYTYARIMFVTRSCAIALLLDKQDVEQDDEPQEPDKNTRPEPKKTPHKSKNGKNPMGFKG